MRANVIGRRHSAGHERILDPFGAAKVVGAGPNEGIQGHGTPLFACCLHWQRNDSCAALAMLHQ